ncbi:MAG: hypothetical protein QX199_09290 [Methylococcaceae bacterium]
MKTILKKLIVLPIFNVILWSGGYYAILMLEVVKKYPFSLRLYQGRAVRANRQQHIRAPKKARMARPTGLFQYGTRQSAP